MQDRRFETRLLCADLVDISWKIKGGRLKKGVANLEDISLSGACLQVERPLPLEAVVRISHSKGDLLGTVRYCVFRDIGYFLGVEFEAGSRWTLHQFKPQHLLDPRRLVLRSIHRVSRANSAGSGLVH
jgi:hypothetical protein